MSECRFHHKKKLTSANKLKRRHSAVAGFNVVVGLVEKSKKRVFKVSII